MQVGVAMVISVALALPLVRVIVPHDYGSATDLIVPGALLLLSLGVAARLRIALRMAAALLLLCALFMPFGVLSPFAASDYLFEGLEPPTGASILLWLIPVELCVLAVAWVLDLDPRGLASREF